MNKTGATTGIFYRTTFYIPLEDKPKMDWSNYCVVGLISVIVILGIIGSFVSKSTTSESLPIKVLKCFSFKDNFSKIITVSKTP